LNEGTLLRASVSVLLLLLALPAGAQTAGSPAPAAGKPRALAGRCGSANWVCVSRCVDVSCVDKCLADGCEQALHALKVCAEQSGCGGDDSVCVAKACGKQCERTFEPAPKSRARAQPEPCANLSPKPGPVPKEVVGLWTLSAASLKPEEREGMVQGEDPHPRADYARTLRVTPEGCFVLSTKLEDATLGRGNQLEVRAWGAVQVGKGKTVEVQTKGGQAVGTVCGKSRVLTLPTGQLTRPRYDYVVEEDTLTLTAQEASKQTFQFQRQVE
jgi:hypothetical protein